MALTSSPEQPLPVRTVAKAIGDWVNRLGRVWIEGQITQLNRRPGSPRVFVTLRDPVADVSLSLTCRTDVVDSCEPPLTDGARVAVWAKPTFYLNRGQLSLEAFEIRPLGLGELLARLERIKGVLAAEGLFAPDRKQPLPFLPTTVGVICGRASAAERDVVENARRRWPAVQFRIENVVVQGPAAVTEVLAALQRLDRDEAVNVIVITRGGGSVEDLLPFSDEALCRAVASARTPVISAIGHEQDQPLLDFVADVRASTPTDAGKLVVPDVAEQVTLVTTLRDRARRVLAHRLDTEQRLLDGMRARPVLAEPARELDRRVDEVNALVGRARRCLAAALDAAAADVTHATARVRALSPAATLERGYAVVQHRDGTVVRDATETEVGTPIAIRLAAGRLEAEVTGRSA